jgi:crotonobetainyl-CoA:carnitine CoA-transferase CaiB-like acyl-CoA transferase
MAHNEGPLAGVTILAVEQFGAGPFGTLLLADLGAQVIKIEDPGAGGDVGRGVPPGAANGSSLYFEAFNRSKQSVTLDLSTPAGQEALHALVAHADAVFNNLRGDLPGRLGLTYNALSTFNPAVVCVSLSAYGRTGERRTYPGYDALVQAEAGWASLTGEPDAPPARSGLPLADYASGLVAAVGLLAGVIEARRTGHGRDVDTSLFDTALAMLSYQATWGLSAGHIAERLPHSAHPTIVPFQFFATSDGYLAVACAKDKFFAALTARLDLPDLADDPRFASFTERHANRDALLEILAERFATAPTAHWVTLLQGAAPVAPVRSLPEVLDHDLLTAREMLASFTHPDLGEVHSIGMPLHVSGYTPRYHASPALGAHTLEALRAAGLSDDDIARLMAAGAFGEEA